VGIGQEAHVEDHVRVERHAILEAEAQAGDQQALGLSSWPKRARMSARSSCTLKFEVSISVSATLRMGSSSCRSSTMERETVSERPSGCGRRVSE
jgi:hypothetical protein